MSSSAVTRCQSCQAVINVTWETCPSCTTPIDTLSRSTPSAASVVSGAVIIWIGADGKPSTGVVDFLHTDPDGTRWAFVSLLDGLWTALNLKYLRQR